MSACDLFEPAFVRLLWPAFFQAGGSGRPVARCLAFRCPVVLSRARAAYAPACARIARAAGWVVAGQVLAAAANASSWCDALHATLLTPLRLRHTYCQRNELSASDEAHLAAVHKANPCAVAAPGSRVPHGRVPLATYAFVKTATTAPTDFAWGATDAAGSVLSSAHDMASVMEVLLGLSRTPLLARPVLEEMMSGQMVTLPSWQAEAGVSGWVGPGARLAGRVASAGLGFDLVMELALWEGGTRHAYAEKNGDTDMHKARLGLLPDDTSAILLLSNLGGSVGGALTALKFGALALLAGGSTADADAAAARALNTTSFWIDQWPGMVGCSQCGMAGGRYGQCRPAGLHAPPLPLRSWVGRFGAAAYGRAPLLTLDMDGSGDGGDGAQLLRMSLGPFADVALSFSNTSAVFGARGCAALGDALAPSLPSWSARDVRARLGAIGNGNGTCTAAEWIAPAEAPSAGVSASAHTVAFPWGCGPVPLPDGPSVYVVSHRGRGLLVVFMGEVFWEEGKA